MGLVSVIDTKRESAKKPLYFRKGQDPRRGGSAPKGRQAGSGAGLPPPSNLGFLVPEPLQGTKWRIEQKTSRAFLPGLSPGPRGSDRAHISSFFGPEPYLRVRISGPFFVGCVRASKGLDGKIGGFNLPLQTRYE